MDLEAIGKTITEKKIAIGVIDHHTLQVESPDEVAAQIRAALKFIAPERLVISSDCGMGREGMSRRHAYYKMVSLVLGTIITPLRIRGRLPKSWRHGTESERFLYGATSFFAVAMVGFAVTSSFVSFAWMDPVYFMAALLTGLYVALHVELEEALRRGNGSAFQSTSPNRAPGWRVNQSTWRVHMLGQSLQRTE